MVVDLKKENTSINLLMNFACQCVSASMFVICLRCGVSVWFGDDHPVYCSHAEEEDCRPSSSD